MLSLKHRFFTLLAVLAVIVAVSVTNPGSTAAQGNRPPTPVEIVGPTPLPVSGTVGLSGTPTVAVTNTPAVTISGNTPAAPLYVRDVDNPARQPVELNFDQTMADGAVQTGCPRLYTVPADKRLVIEYVNLSGIGPANPVESLLFIVESVPTYTFMTEQRGNTQTGSLSYSLNQTARIYFGPGQVVSMCATRGLLRSGSMTARAKLTGYLVDVP